MWTWGQREKAISSHVAVPFLFTFTKTQICHLIESQGICLLSAGQWKPRPLQYLTIHLYDSFINNFMCWRKLNQKANFFVFISSFVWHLTSFQVCITIYEVVLFHHSNIYMPWWLFTTVRHSRKRDIHSFRFATTRLVKPDLWGHDMKLNGGRLRKVLDSRCWCQKTLSLRANCHK